MNDEFNVFLLIGQSNMAGRGRPDEVPRLGDSRISMFRNGRWTVADEPLHTDKPNKAGVGLGMSFAAKLLSHNPEISIGLIPCAVGGTPLSRWMPGADLYKNAVTVTQSALSKGSLEGILWHQGESDSSNCEDATSYGERFQEMVQSLRSQLSAEGVAVIGGELGEFLQDHDGCEFFELVNRQLCQLEGSLPAYGCVRAKGLTDNGDSVHFNSKSLREFGVRYSRKYMEITETYGRST